MPGAIQLSSCSEKFGEIHRKIPAADLVLSKFTGAYYVTKLDFVAYVPARFAKILRTRSAVDYLNLRRCFCQVTR